jgi:murein DD-endopeptidase MepM/ murein hydrolase activator NlpD
LKWGTSPRFEEGIGAGRPRAPRRRGGLHRGAMRIARAGRPAVRRASRGLLVIPLVIAGASGAADRPYHAPIAATCPVSSSFGEYRVNHFHGGIDFSTFGEIGLPVHAVADGWVWRVRCSGSGYGRALYLRLADGRTQLTAHQERFAPAIADFVAAAQESLGRYEVDLSPPPGRLPVKRGEIVAWSGESGAGPPHLHFEMREGEDANIGVNPRVFGFGDADTTPPVISRLVVTPVGAGATVAGEPAVRAWPATRGSDGRYRLAAPVTAAGAVRFGLDVVDPAPRDNRLAPQRVELLEGDRVVYDARLDRFDWTRAHEVECFYDLAEADRGRRFVVNLDRPPGGLGPEYATVDVGAGILSPPAPPGAVVRDLVLRATDSAGNAAVLAVTLRQAALPVVAAMPAPPPAAAAGTAGHAGATVTAAGLVARVPGAGDTTHAWLDLGPARAPSWWDRLTGRASAPVRTHAVRLSAGGEALLDPPDRFVVRPALRTSRQPGASDTLDVVGVVRGQAQSAAFGDFRVSFADSAVFAPAWLGMSIDTVAAVPGFAPVSPGYRLWAPGVALDRAARFAIRGVAADPRVGLFRSGGGTSWSWVGNAAGPDGLGGDTRYLGTFVLARDASVPTITILAPAAAGANRKSATGSRAATTTIRARLTDTGSGLAPLSITAAIDDIPQFLEWDPEAQVLSGPMRGSPGAGAHRLVITATDRAGNTARAERSFTTR